MRVAMDGWALGSGLGGDEAMLTSLLRGLAATARSDDRFCLHAPPQTELPGDVAGWPGLSVRHRPRRSGAAHFALSLPVGLRRPRPRPEVVFSVTHAPLCPPAPVALMVTDLSFHRHPASYPAAARLRLNALVPRQARRAGAVLTISEFCRRDIVDAFGLPADRVFVVPLAVDPPAPLDTRAAEGTRRWIAGAGVAGPFVLYLGNLHPRKNVARLIRAFAAARRASPEVARHQLVVAGARWWGEGEEQQAAGSAPAGSVVFLGRVDAAQREHLLASAAALAYVSLFEGFGLPPLEAMVRGTPVLASSTTAIPETVGDGALLVDPADEASIAAGLVRLVEDPELRRRLVERGRRRAAGFTVERTGERVRAALATAAGR